MRFGTIDSLKERKKNGTFREIFTDWKWIFSYTKRFKGSIILYTVLGLLSSTLGLVSSIAGKFLVDVVIGHKVDQLWLAAVVIAGSALLTLAVGNFSGHIKQRLDVDMTHAIRSDVFDSIMEADWESLNSFSNGDVLHRFHGDISTISSNAVDWLPSMIITAYSFIATFVVIWHYSPVMSLIALSSAPVLMLMSRYLVEKQKNHRKEMAQMTSSMYAFETEALYNLDTVKSFGIKGMFKAQLKDLQAQYRHITMAWHMFQIKTNVFMTIVSLLVEYAAYGYALFLLWGGQITYGTMTLFLQQRSNLSGNFHSLVGTVPGFINGSVAAHRLQELLKLPREKHGEQDIPEEYFQGKLTVKMNLVDFAYNNGEKVIERSDFIAEPGKITALVGPSGEGKTTVLRLLLGIVQPEEGSCTFVTENGDALNLNADSRVLISYVPQGNSLMSGTIAQNMRLARKEATDEEIIAALKMACAWEFVEKLEKGIYSEIQEKGKGLSEGQAQRIAIARALLRDAPVMLMDEATSALDVETERNVLKNILQKSPEKTFIITTHRPTVLSMCDKVYRVVDRKITELGQEEVETIVRNF